MTNLKQKIIVFLIIALFLTVVPVGVSKATLQANPNTHVKKTDSVVNWMTNIRNMEKPGEAMGLNEDISEDLTSSDSNNIDVHMVKSTEYGACAILSASGYGNPQILQESEIKTTTGNKTGVYFTGTNWEYVAGGLEGGIPNGVNPIYYDKYTADSNITKVGDALGTSTTTNPGCRGWHSASISNWCDTCFFRGGIGVMGEYGGLFGFGNSSYFSVRNTVACGRGVAVCGEGL